MCAEHTLSRDNEMYSLYDSLFYFLPADLNKNVTDDEYRHSKHAILLIFISDTLKHELNHSN